MARGSFGERFRTIAKSVPMELSWPYLKRPKRATLADWDTTRKSGNGRKGSRVSENVGAAETEELSKEPTTGDVSNNGGAAKKRRLRVKIVEQGGASKERSKAEKGSKAEKRLKAWTEEETARIGVMQKKQKVGKKQLAAQRARSAAAEDNPDTMCRITDSDSGEDLDVGSASDLKAPPVNRRKIKPVNRRKIKPVIRRLPQLERQVEVMQSATLPRSSGRRGNCQTLRRQCVQDAAKWGEW